jgi:hypothetical protein
VLHDVYDVYGNSKAFSARLSVEHAADFRNPIKAGVLRINGFIFSDEIFLHIEQASA